MSAIWSFQEPNSFYRSPFIDADLSNADDRLRRCSDPFRPARFILSQSIPLRKKVCRPEAEPVCWLDYLGSDEDEGWSTRSLRKLGFFLGSKEEDTERESEINEMRSNEIKEDGVEKEDEGSDKERPLSAIEMYFQKRNEVLQLDKAVILPNSGKPLASTDDSWKTELCKNWNSEGRCKYGAGCHFAHGQKEMRERLRREEFKTKICDTPAQRWSGKCSYTTRHQKRCNYCHPGEALRVRTTAPYHDSTYHEKIRELFGDDTAPFGLYI